MGWRGCGGNRREPWDEPQSVTWGSCVTADTRSHSPSFLFHSARGLFLEQQVPVKTPRRKPFPNKQGRCNVQTWGFVKWTIPHTPAHSAWTNAEPRDLRRRHPHRSRRRVGGTTGGCFSHSPVGPWRTGKTSHPFPPSEWLGERDVQKHPPGGAAAPF